MAEKEARNVRSKSPPFPKDCQAERAFPPSQRCMSMSQHPLISADAG